MSLFQDITPRSLGHPLTGTSAVRYVFIDEAGISDDEPVTIVAAIIAHADQHVMLADRSIAEILGAVPLKFRDGFYFHATDIWGSAKYRDDWLMADRVALMKDMMALPARLGLAIAMGHVRRDNPPPPDLDGLSNAQHQHKMAFHRCLAAADKYVRDFGGLTEVATVVAEDLPDMRQHLARTIDMPKGGFVAAPNHVVRTQKEQAQGYSRQESDIRITRIRRPIHFVEKGQEPLLQLADACAFAMRRYFSQLEFGVDFMAAMVGPGNLPNLADFTAAYNAQTWIPHPPKHSF